MLWLSFSFILHTESRGDGGELFIRTFNTQKLLKPIKYGFAWFII